MHARVEFVSVSHWNRFVKLGQAERVAATFAKLEKAAAGVKRDLGTRQVRQIISGRLKKL